MCSLQRSGTDPVPGCLGVPDVDKDYCVPAETTLPPTPNPTAVPTNPLPTSEPTALNSLQRTFSGTGAPPNPLPECHGDCDDDTQCEGDLQCFQRYVCRLSTLYLLSLSDMCL